MSTRPVSKALMTSSSRSSERGRRAARCGAAALAALLLLCGGCRQKAAPQADQAIVHYRNQDIVMPMTIDNVVSVREYYVHGELYQLIVYEDGALTPVVFTPFEIVSYTAGGDVAIEVYEDQVFHTYDPFLQQTKNELRKAFIYEAYEKYFGREPSEEEFNLELEKLIEKTQLEDLEARISTAPEAVVYRINQQRDRELTDAEVARIKRMLEDGKSADEIVEAFVK